MISRERFFVALERRVPDRLPVTTHHVTGLLSKCTRGTSSEEFFDAFGLDPVLWLAAPNPDWARGDFYDPSQPDPGPREPRRVLSDDWRIEADEVPG